MVKVIVTGSREWPPLQARQVWKVLADVGPDLVIHGGCEDGVDAMAERWCRANDVDSHSVRAKWRASGQLDRGAGHARNARMLGLYPGLQVLAFPFGKSPGTHGCIRAAVRGNHPVIIFNVHWPLRSFTPDEWFAMEKP